MLALDGRTVNTVPFDTATDQDWGKYRTLCTHGDELFVVQDCLDAVDSDTVTPLAFVLGR